MDAQLKHLLESNLQLQQPFSLNTSIFPLKMVDFALKVATKLRSIEAVSTELKKKQSFESYATSLAYGYPGLVVLYSTLNELFPNGKWDEVADAYLKISVNSLENYGANGYSLFLGIGGICFATFLASNNQKRYCNLLDKLDCALIQEIQRSFLTVSKKYIQYRAYIPSELYNLTEGISGVLGYLIIRKNNEQLHQICIESLETLVFLLSVDKFIDGNKIPGWYLSQDIQLTAEAKVNNPKGSFSLSYPYGITGVLAVLSIAALEGIIVPGQILLIEKIGYWLEKKQKQSAHGPCYEHSLGLNDEINVSKHPSGLTRDAWCYGVPAIARSLFLAAHALNNEPLKQRAEALYLTVFQKPTKEWNLIGTSFSYGRAGFLTLTYRMAQDTKNSLLIEKTTALEEDLIRFYDHNHIFGFQMVNMSLNYYEWEDNPGLLDGATGVALSLLLTYSGGSLLWDRTFLTH